MTRAHLRLMVVGATGLVGGEVLARLLADARVQRVVAPTRRGLPPHAKLENPVVDFERLPRDAPWWAVDAVVCALGTTIKDAGSQAAFRDVDFGLVVQVARAARDAGASTFALTSSLGADARSRNFYLRTKGEAEDAVAACGFDSFTCVRPSVIGGKRDRRRPAEAFAMRALGMLAPVIPRRYRVVPAASIAVALIEAAIAGPPGRHIVQSEALGEQARR